MKSCYYLLLLVLLFRLPLPAQVNTDSLRILMLNEKDPAKKTGHYVAMCEYFRMSNPDSLLTCAKAMQEHARKHNNDLWHTNADYYTAIYYNLTGNPDTAFVIAEQAITSLKNSQVGKPLLMKIYSLAGNSLMRLNRQKDALAMFYSGMQQAENTNDIDALFKAQNNIGWAYMELEQYEKAIEHFRKSIQTIRHNGIADRYGTIYNNMASCYGSLGIFDSVYRHAKTGIDIAKKYNDFAVLANGNSIMGTFLAKEKKYSEALASFKEAVSIREKSGDPFFIVSDLAEISELQAQTGNTTDGIANGRKALAIATENKIDAKLPMIHTALAHNYERAGNYREAAESYKILNSLKDSLYKDANPKALAEIQTKYETVKKEQQIEQQKNKIARQNLLFIGFALLAILLSLLFYSQYKRYRLKKEAQMQSEIRRQQELATKAVMQAEENERQRIAKDLHDGVGQMMSAAKMNLSAFESEISFDQPDQKRSFEKVIQLVDESCREVRTVSHIMMPNALMKNNLSAAIHAFVEKLDKKSLQVHVYTEGLEQRLDSNTELVLYRVLQECVNNVIRHAGASTLDISVTRSAENIVATVEDNGRGFDITDKTKPEGMGLKNIRARVEYLKGTVDIDSIPGQGTVIAIHVPL